MNLANLVNIARNTSEKILKYVADWARYTMSILYILNLYNLQAN